jgi:PEP-CTERM motif
MTSMIGRLLLAACLAAPLVSQAVDITAGTAAVVRFRNCIPGVTACDTFSSLVDEEYGGSPGATSSSVAATVDGYGTASASASFSGTIGAPILHAYSSSLPGTRTNAVIVALQSYTYTGDTDTTRNFGGTLTYDQTLTGMYPDPNDSGTDVLLEAFTMPASTVEVGTTAADNFAALSGQTWPATWVGEAEFFDDSHSGPGTASLNMLVPLTPGETIWILAEVTTPAVNGNIIDVSHTLVTGWDVTSDLTPAVMSSPVPEPSPWALFGAGVAALLAWRRVVKPTD